MGWFFLQHLNRLYDVFRGDLLMPIVLGEIAHHNICHHFSSGRPTTRNNTGNWMGREVWETMEPCSSYSLSLATGIPRETCRRKVSALARQGLVVRHPGGGYIIARHVMQHFRDTNRETFASVWAFLKDVQAVLEKPAPPTPG